MVDRSAKDWACRGIKGTEILEPAMLNAVSCSGNNVPGRALLHDIYSDGNASTLSIVA
jgi:hypothetical protein